MRRMMILPALLCLTAGLARAQSSEGGVRLGGGQPPLSITIGSDAGLEQSVRERYEEIEIMARLLDRGLSRDAHVGALTDSVRGMAFSPDGKVLASGTYSGGVRLWDAGSGKQIAAHGAEDFSGAQGVYLKGQGVVYTLTIPLHFQKPLSGPDKPAPKALTEWERVRKELHGEKVEGEKGKQSADTSIADAVLKVLADNGKNLTRLPDGESVTVAITLLPAQSCVHCHSGTGGGGMRGPMGGSGMMPPGGMSGGPSSLGGGAPGSGWAPPGAGGGSPGGGGRPSGGLGGGPSGGGGSGGTAESEPNTDRAEFRKYALLGDLAMKQHDYNQAVQAFMKAGAVYREPPRESDAQLEVIEVATKLARALIAQGKTAEAERVVQTIVKLSDGLAGSAPAKSADAKAPMRLPGKLIITVPKKILDNAGSGRMSFDEFRKSASVEHLTFDKPAEKAKGDANKP